MLMIFILLALACLCSESYSKTISVSPTGAITTLMQANDQGISPGDIIEFTSGTYSKQQWLLDVNGNASSHVTIRAASGAKVIFEGSTVVSLFHLSRLSYVDFIGPFEICNTSDPGKKGLGHGILLTRSSHCTIKNCYVHHIDDNGIMVTGWDNSVSNCNIHDACLANKYGNGTSWGEGLVANFVSHDNPTILSKNILFENNHVDRIFGEGIDFIGCDGCVARGNTVGSTLSAAYYVDNSMNCLLERNSVWFSDTSIGHHGNRASAFNIGTEVHSNITVSNVTFRDNVGSGGGSSFQYTNQRGCYHGIKIIHNTLYNMSGYCLNYPSCPTPNSGTEARLKNEFSNNILSCSHGLGIVVGSNELSDWTSKSNALIGRTSLPSAFSSDSTSFVIQSTVNVNSFFETFLPNCKQADCYKPNCNGPFFNGSYLGTASASSSTTDFFGIVRDSQHPTIGFSECQKDHHYQFSSNNQHGNNDNSNEKHTSTSAKIFPTILLLMGLWNLANVM